MNLVIVDSLKAWSVTIGVLLINSMIVGFLKIYSLIIVEFHELLNVPMSLLFFGASLLTSELGILAPIALIISHKISVRLSGILSSIIAIFSLILMSLSKSAFLQITSAGLLGLSFALIYTPSFPLPRLCHARFQSISQAIVSSGGSLGALILPLILSQLINLYSIRGFILIIGAIMGHFAVASLLLPTIVISVKDNKTKVIFFQRNCVQKENSNFEKFQIRKYSLDSNYINQNNHKFKLPPKKLWISLVIYSMALACIMNGYMFLSTLFGAFAKSLDLSIVSSAYFLIGHSILDFIARIILGSILDFTSVPKWLVYSINASILAVVTILTSAFPSIPMLYLYMITNALCGGSLLVLQILVLADRMGLQNLSSSFTIYIFSQGIMAIIFYYVVGVLCEYAGSVTIGLLIAGIKIGIGGLLLIIEQYTISR